MIKCPDCNKNTRQYMATHIGDTVKRYNYCKNCDMVFIEVIDSPKGYAGELIKIIPMKKKCSSDVQTTLI